MEAILKPGWLARVFRDVEHEAEMISLRSRLSREDQKKVLEFAATLPSFPLVHDPSIIRSDQDLERHTSLLFRLTEIGNPNEADYKAIEQLGAAIEAYENEHHLIPKP